MYDLRHGLFLLQFTHMHVVSIFEGKKTVQITAWWRNGVKSDRTSKQEN